MLSVVPSFQSVAKIISEGLDRRRWDCQLSQVLQPTRVFLGPDGHRANDGREKQLGRLSLATAVI